MAKKFYWLKLNEDFFRQPRIKKLRRIANGEIKTVKIGRTIRISEYEVERLKRGE